MDIELGHFKPILDIIRDGILIIDAATLGPSASTRGQQLI